MAAAFALLSLSAPHRSGRAPPPNFIRSKAAAGNTNRSPKSRNLICGTCVGIGRRGIQIERIVFDLVIIDEAARWASGFLVGDQAHLPPLLRVVAARFGFRSRTELAKSDLERAFDSKYGAAVQRILKRQCRMAKERAGRSAGLLRETGPSSRR